MLRFHIILWILILTLSTVSFSQTTRQDTLKQLMRKVEILTKMLEKQRLGEVAYREYKNQFGLGPAASQVYRKKKSGVSLAGYGEIIYQNYNQKTDAGSLTDKKDQIDYLRNILYIGYKFNDRFLFNSEIEFEHALTGGGNPGEVALEFGYIDAILSPALAIRGGMVLIPVGIVNELHEPSTFYGTLRPQPERQIIPTTWRSNGLGIMGGTESGIGYRFYVVEGLNAASFSASGIRKGRQSGAKAIAEDLALTGRLEYMGIPGLTLGASFFAGNSGQGMKDSSGVSINARTILFAFHGILARKGFEIRALYAQTHVNETKRLNQFLGFNGSQSIGNKQYGYYLTLAYDVWPLISSAGQAQVYPYVQYEKINPQAEVPEGFASDPENVQSNLILGVMIKPISQIGLKVEFINRKNDAGTGLDQFNMGLTYLF